MGSRELKHKPLIEAIFEIRWELSENASGVEVDPHYKLLPGRLYDRLQARYPEHEQLDSALIPDEMSGHMVQHRFRSRPADWPLIQIGPGVLTVNDTAKYNWGDFRARVLEATAKLYETYPGEKGLRPSKLILRYIDAVDFDHRSDDTFKFLSEKLKITVGFLPSLFENTGVSPEPFHHVTQSLFRSENPLGVIHLKFATGQRGGKPAIIWETTIESASTDIPEMPAGFENWLDAGHKLVNDWFFKMIDGDLHRRFTDA